jgi:N-acylneuraminate cytidylyltransferase
MNIVVIPARGGSKRIPRKNIKDFQGKPMIVWSIEAALASKVVDRVVVSTDDSEIADVALQYGAEVPFIRPKVLSDDFTGTTAVVKHALEQLMGERQISAVCCLYATAPFVQSEDLDRGCMALKEEGVDYAFSVTSYSFPIQRAIKIRQDNRVEVFYPEYINSRSQDLEEGWHDAGQFYWGTPDAWLHERLIFGPSSVPIVLPRSRVQDIDTSEDWDRAEWLFKTMQQ